MTKQAFALQDAKEMLGILRSAECMKRYDQISHQLLSEILVAISVKGEVIGGNNRGSDVRSTTHGLIEVKSRILGTDTAFPRVSLRLHNLEKASWFAAVRWARDFTFYDAFMLPKSSAFPLYSAKRQKNGQAHINWNVWISDPCAVSLKSAIMIALGEGKTGAAEE